jgi:Tfp pilus assembly protein PilO
MTMMRKVGLIALAGVLVVVAGWYIAFWRPESSHLQALKAQQTKAAANVSQLETQVAVLRVLQREVPAEKAALAKLDQDVPEGPSLDQLLDVLDHSANVAGVTLTSISTPQPASWGGSAGTSSATSGAGPESMTLSISVNGSNAGLLRFIAALDSAPRLFVVDNFALNNGSSQTSNGSSGSASSTGSTGLTVETYYVSSASGDPASSFPLAKVTPVAASTGAVSAAAPVSHRIASNAKAPAAGHHHSG